MSIEENADGLSRTDDPPSFTSGICQSVANPESPSPEDRDELRSGPDFPQSPHSQAFREKFFPEATVSDWNNWHWQLQQTLRTVDDLARIVALTADEREAMVGASGGADKCFEEYIELYKDL